MSGTTVIKPANDFQFEGRCYTRDPGNGRCYLMERSRDRRGEMSGAMVRRRVSEAAWMEAIASFQGAAREAAAAPPDPAAGLPFPASGAPLLRYPPGKGPLCEGLRRWA